MGAAAIVGLRSDVAARAGLVQRMKAEISGANAVAESAAVVRQRFVALAPSILSGRTDAAAVADLGSRLSAAAGSHGSTFARADAIPDSVRVGWLKRITVRFALESDLAGVLATLAAAERDPAVLSIRSVRLVAADPGSSDLAPEIISAEATVSGWYLTSPPDPE